MMKPVCSKPETLQSNGSQSAEPRMAAAQPGDLSEVQILWALPQIYQIANSGVGDSAIRFKQAFQVAVMHTQVSELLV